MFSSKLLALVVLTLGISAASAQVPMTGGGRAVPAAAGGGAVTLNPSDKGANVLLTNGNLTAMNSSNAGALYDAARSTTSHSSGKYYLEWTFNVSGANNFTLAVGIANASMLTAGVNPGIDANLSIADYGGNTFLKLNNISVGTVPTVSNGLTAGLAIDIDNKLIYLWRGAGTGWNNGSADPTTQTGGISFSAITGPYFPFLAPYRGNTVQGSINFGGTAYSFTPPVGFGNW